MTYLAVVEIFSISNVHYIAEEKKKNLLPQIKKGLAAEIWHIWHL